MGLIDRVKNRLSEHKAQRELSRASRREIARKAKAAYWKAREREAIRIARRRGKMAARPVTERASKRLSILAGSAKRAYTYYEKAGRNINTSKFAPNTVFGNPINLGSRHRRRKKRVILYY